MSYSTLAAPIAGTPITVAYQVLVNDDIAWLRALLPDAGASGLALISTGTGTAAFAAIPDSAMEHAKVTKAGDAMSGPLSVSHGGALVTGGIYAAGGIEIISSPGGAAVPAIGFLNQGIEASGLYYQSGHFHHWDSAQVAPYTIWDSGNDGPGSGLDADLLDGQSSAYYAVASTLATEISTRASADTTEATARAAADTALSTAITAAQAAAIAASIAAPTAKSASGQYTGNGAGVGRWFAVGFLAKLVVIYDATALTSLWVSIATNGALTINTTSTAATSLVHVHASDGFMVADGGTDANINGRDYRWTCIG